MEQKLKAEADDSTVTNDQDAGLVEDPPGNWEIVEHVILGERGAEGAYERFEWACDGVGCIAVKSEVGESTYKTSGEVVCYFASPSKDRDGALERARQKMVANPGTIGTPTLVQGLTTLELPESIGAFEGVSNRQYTVGYECEAGLRLSVHKRRGTSAVAVRQPDFTLKLSNGGTVIQSVQSNDIEEILETAREWTGAE